MILVKLVSSFNFSREGSAHVRLPRKRLATLRSSLFTTIWLRNTTSATIQSSLVLGARQNRILASSLVRAPFLVKSTAKIYIDFFPAHSLTLGKQIVLFLIKRSCCGANSPRVPASFWELSLTKHVGLWLAIGISWEIDLGFELRVPYYTETNSERDGISSIWCSISTKQWSAGIQASKQTFSFTGLFSMRKRRRTDQLMLSGMVVSVVPFLSNIRPIRNN